MSHTWVRRTTRPTASAAPATSSCRVQLVEQKSRTLCDLNRNYGCYPGGKTMWVNQGCRGRFRCSETVIHCGKFQGRQYNCTCLWDTWDTYTYASEQETVRALSTIGTRQIKRTDRWLAAIISTNVASPRFQKAASSVTAAGFDVRQILAATPGSYRGKKEMLQDLFGRADNQSVMVSMTAFEIALLISHKRALRAIALSNYAWGAVFEDDAYLHEAVQPMHAQHLIAAAIAAADAAPQRSAPPLLYIGGCKPSCDADVVTGRDQTALAAGLPGELLRVGRCKAYCTHAYALSRGSARTFFDDVFGCRNGTRGCGSECDLYPCWMDWSMYRHFERSGEAWIVGGGLQSPWVEKHRGLFIQNRSSAVFRSAGFRSRLAKGFRWRNDSKAILDEQSCERGLAVNATSRATPLQNLHIAIKWNGRVGNLMFEVAMLAGVLQRVREIVPETAASAVTFGLPSTASVPAAELFQQFPVSTLVREELNGLTAFDQQLAGCTACKLVVSEHFVNRCDAALLRRIAHWVAKPPAGCKIGLIRLEGWFQCRHYFDGRASELLRSTVFAPAAAAQREADAILASAKHPSGGKLVGVQVRLGDKVSGRLSSLSEPTTFAYYRTAMEQISAMLIHRGAAGITFVVTAGGTKGGNADDIAAAKGNLTDGFGHRVFFSTASSPYVDLAVLRRCDALVIGPSTFGWWAAYLANLPLGHVVAPRHLYNQNLPRGHPLLKGFRQDEYYPSDWRLLDNDGTMRQNWIGWPDPPPPPPPPPPSPPKPPPPKPVESSPCAQRPRRSCYLRIVGSCPGYSRPQYRNWWPAFVHSRETCVKKQRAWLNICKNRPGAVEMSYCGDRD